MSASMDYFLSSVPIGDSGAMEVSMHPTPKKAALDGWMDRREIAAMGGDCLAIWWSKGQCVRHWVEMQIAG